MFSSIDHTLSANVETLVLQGSGNVSGTGNALANNLHGNSGDNTLNGGAGADLLTGNAGNDTFVFNVGQGNGDTIVRLRRQRRSGGRFAAVRRLRDGGAGATFTNIDVTNHWQINYNGGAPDEIITFMNGAAVDAGDVVFA